MNGSERHSSSYLFWRINKEEGHCALDFQPADLCFEITDWLFLPGDLSWVFGSAKGNKGLGMKDPALCNLTNSRKPQCWSPRVPQSNSGGDTGSKGQLLEEKSTTNNVLEKNNIATKRRRSWRLKRLREGYDHSITTDWLASPVCPDDFDDEDTWIWVVSWSLYDGINNYDWRPRYWLLSTRRVLVNAFLLPPLWGSFQDAKENGWRWRYYLTAAVALRSTVDPVLLASCCQRSTKPLLPWFQLSFSADWSEYHGSDDGPHRRWYDTLNCIFRAVAKWIICSIVCWGSWVFLSGRLLLPPNDDFSLCLVCQLACCLVGATNNEPSDLLLVAV